MAAPSLTILVPTNDRPNVLARVWPTWLEQEGLAELVVVNDGSVRDYSAVLAGLRAACDRAGVGLKVFELPQRRGAPAARNAGLALCSSDEILTVDDDILLTPDVVRRCRDARPPGSLTIVGPRVVYLRDGETEADAEARAVVDPSPYFDRRTVTVVPWVRLAKPVRVPFVTAVALWPRAVFSGGLRYFEGYSGNGYREETDPQIEAQRRFGAEVLFAPAGRVFHLPPGIAYAAKSGQRRSNGLAFEWHVARNNAVFMTRHGGFLATKFGVRPLASWISLLASRLSPRRLARFGARRAARRLTE